MRIVAAAGAVVVVLLYGVWLGGHPETLPAPLRDWLVEQGPAVRADVIDTIQQHYYKAVSKAKLEEDSLRGMVMSLNDPYTRYFTPKEAKSFSDDLSGKFEGVGMSVHPATQGLLVIDTFAGAPARKAGMRGGDVITAVDGTSIAGEGINVATERIKGPPGTFVDLTVRRGKKTLHFHVQRAKINVPEVQGKLVTRGGKKVGVVSLASFSSGVHGTLRRQIDRQLKAGAQGLVVDLRGDPGGLVTEAQLVCSIFLPKGQLVTTTKGRAVETHVYKAVGDPIPAKIPVVVLVDQGTASASEITSGALEDTHRATIVGTRTYGKGVFQEVHELQNGGALDLTEGRYYLPNGEPLPKDGVQPQVKAQDDPKTARDEALPVALRVLLSKLP